MLRLGKSKTNSQRDQVRQPPRTERSQQQQRPLDNCTLKSSCFLYSHEKLKQDDVASLFKINGQDKFKVIPSQPSQQQKELTIDDQDDRFSFQGKNIHSNDDQDQIGSDKDTQNQRKMTKFDALLLKHYDQNSQIEQERMRQKEREDMERKISKISLNIQADPFEYKGNKENLFHPRAHAEQEMPYFNREPLSQINRAPNLFQHSQQNIPMNSMNHPFAKKQFHHQSYQSNYPYIYQNMPQQPDYYQMEGYDQENKENIYQPPQSYPRPQQQPYPCYFIQVPNQPMFSHALYPYPVSVNQPMMYAQQPMPPPPPGFPMPPQQQQQQYIFVNQPPPPPPRPPQFNHQFEQSHIPPQQQHMKPAEELHQINEASELPQFIGSKKIVKIQDYLKEQHNPRTPTDDFSESSFTPTTFSRDYIKKKLDFNSPLSIMSFKREKSPVHDSTIDNPPKPFNIFDLCSSSGTKEQFLSSRKKNKNQYTPIITPQKKKKGREFQVPHSDSKYDKKKELKLFGDRVDNIFDKVKQLQLSKTEEIDKECRSAEKAMKRAW